MVKKRISLCLAAGIIATGLWGCSAPATPESDMSGETQGRREEDIPRGRYVAPLSCSGKRMAMKLTAADRGRRHSIMRLNIPMTSLY